MQDIGCKLSRTAAVVVIVLAACVGSAWASGFAGGKPWQIGDVIVCFGSGTCNVLRIDFTQQPPTVTLLDQFSDGSLFPSNTGGVTNGVAINNTLHLLVTDNAANKTNSSTSNVVEYTIASLNPLLLSPTVVTHVPATSSPFNDAGANATAVVVNSAGQMFVGNAGSGSPSIAELDPNGQLTTASSVPPLVLPSNPFPLPAGCTDSATPTLLSMDLSADGKSLYITSGGGTIQNLALKTTTTACTPFADFGSGVTLFGIKDIPAKALTNPLTNTSQTCKSTSCPTDESILVVAQGFTDPANETGEPASDPDAINICTTRPQTESPSVSCALLLDKTPPPGSLWKASTQYLTLSAPVLDPSLHVQTVNIAGTSGLDEPPFSSAPSGTVIDNAVIWTNQGQPAWAGDHPYAVVAPALPTSGTYIVDSNFDLETVTSPGISGHGLNPPTWVAKTVDGLQWNDLGNSVWMPNTQYFTTGKLISDPLTHAQQVFQSGTSALSGITPVGGWNDGGGQTIEGVTWTESNPTWIKNTSFAVGTLIIDNTLHIQQVQQAGTSANSGNQPNFGNTTDENTVTWVDLGQAVWRPNFGYGLNAIILDSGGHVQQVTVAGISGPNPPPFLDNGSSVTPDGGVSWTDRGTLSGNTSFTWQPSNAYGQNDEIIDGGLVISGTQTAVTASETGNTVTLTAGSNFAPSFNTGNMINVSGCTPSGYNGTFPIASVSGGTALTYLDPISGLGAGSGCSVQAANANVGLVAVAGTSGFGIQTPPFVDGGTVVDNTEIWADLGQAVWRANFSYGLNAIIVDGTGNVQQVTTAGKTGASQPSFTGGLGTQTVDGTVTWTNQGSSGSAPFTWQPGFQYSLNAMIIDSNNHVQLATNTGQSGAGPTPPSFVDGGSVIDGLIWAAQVNPGWIANHPYSAVAGPVPVPGTYILDSNNHLEEVTAPGISGPSTPTWPQSGQTIDGLIWADKGAWLAGHQYFALGQPVGDSNGHVHTVLATGTSGSGPSTPFGGWNDLGGSNGGLTAAGITIDNAVIWTESHPNWKGPSHTYKVGNPDTLILDTNNNVQLVTNDDTHSVGASAIGGPTQPSAAGNNPWKTATGDKTIDGLQWINQATPTTSVVARYPVMGTNTLQALSLDPLVTDCTGSNCSSTLQPPTISNFWLADAGSASFYHLDFATGAGGTPTALNGAPSCPGNAQQCSSYVSFAHDGIQGVGIYGGEGSNQPDLTKLLTNYSLQSSNAFSTSVTFPPPVSPFTSNDVNTWTLTAYNVPTPNTTLIPITLYGSLIPSANNAPLNGGNNSGATDPGAVVSTANGFQVIGTTPCQPTTSDPNSCIVWKADVALPSVPNGSPVPYLSEAMSSAISSKIDNGTDMFVDLHYDITTSVGIADPIGKTYTSVHSLHELTPTVPPPNSGPPICTYTSPVQGACYKTNRTTLNFTFQCPGLTQQQFLNLANSPGPPLISLVRRFPNSSPKQAPQSIQLATTNNKAPYRFSSSNNSYTFQWGLNAAAVAGQISLNGTSVLRGCTFDPTNTVQTFCVDFTTSPTCK